VVLAGDIFEIESTRDWLKKTEKNSPQDIEI